MIEGIRLRTLGSLEFVGPYAPDLRALVSQPKRVALLVYLAAARPRGLQRRDTLLALFWPESDEIRARHSLSQLVYYLRRTLGPQALVSLGDEALGIDAAHVWCDVVAFEQALDAKRLEEALDLYGGDFLSGFHVPDAAPELEEWIAAERTRLRTAAAAGAWALAAREEQAGNGTGAAHWGRRAVSLAPDDEHAVRRLIVLLGRLGDRTGALRAYDEFARRLNQEFEITPSPELRALAEKLRRTPASAPRSAVPTDAAPVGTPSTPAGPTGAPAIATSRRSRRLLWGAGAVLITAAVVGTLVARAGRHADASPILAVGAVSDFTHGDTAATAVVVVDLLATSLARLPGIQVIATARLYEVQSQLQAAGHPAPSLYDAARTAGARQLIQGTLHPNPSGGVRLDLERIDIRSGAVRGGYRTEGADLFAAVDQATSAIAGDLGAPAPGEPVANVTTHSLVAYRFYEAGLRAFYQGDGTAAGRLFRSALDEDSTFAMAAYWVWKTYGDRELGYLKQAARLADHATDRERLLIRARLAQDLLEPQGLAIAETLAFRYPAEPDAQMLLGESRAIQGDYLGGIGPMRRVIALDSLAFSGRLAACRACDAYLEMIQFYVYADSFAAAVGVAREWAARQPSSPRPRGGLAGLFEIAGQGDSALAAYRVVDSMMQLTGSHDPERARLALRRGDYEEADLRLRRMVAERSWSDAEWFLAISLRNQGRLEEAAALPIARSTVLQGVLLIERGRWRDAAAFFDRSARPWDPTSPIVGHQAKNMAFNLTHVATSLAAAGDTTRLARLADSIEWAGGHSLSAREAHLARYVRGLLLAARGQLAGAVEEYRSAILSWNEGYTRVNYALAQVLLRLNRPREAIAALQPAFRGSLEAANLYITRTELHELLAQAFDAAGERDSATVHWRAVESAWRNADPEFRGRWEEARRHLSGATP